MTNEDLLLLARGPGSHPMGKLTFQAKTDLPEEVGDVLVAAARHTGMTTAELLREIVCWWACPDLMKRLQDQRADVARGNGPGFVPKG